MSLICFLQLTFTIANKFVLLVQVADRKSFVANFPEVV